ncbi:hypothetical protein D3C86_1646680 [compost metagenome]
MFNQPRDDADRILQVDIHRDHRIAAGIFQAGEQCRLFAEITREVDQQYLVIGLRQRLDLLGRAVGTAIVDEHDLELDLFQLQLTPHRLIKQVDRLFLIEYRDDQRDFHCSRSRNTTYFENRKPSTRLKAENRATVSRP